MYTTALIMTLLGAQLLSGQTSFLTPVTGLPTDAMVLTPISKDKAILIRENGDILLVSHDGNILATLPASAVRNGTALYRYPVAILQGSFSAATVAMDKDGGIYFNTWCDNQGIRTCAINRWDPKTSGLEKIVALGDRILTQGGYVDVQSIERTVATVGNSALFIVNFTKLVRKTGQVFATEYSTATPIGPHLAANESGIYLSNSKATAINILNSQLLKLPGGGAILPTLVPGYWQPRVDFVRNEIYATGDYSVTVKYRESIAHRVSPEPIGEILRTTNAGPMTSNGLRLYLGLDHPWDGRSFAPVFDSLNLYSETEKSWRKIAGIGDELRDGKRLSGLKLQASFEKSLLTLALEGWYKGESAALPTKPTFNGGSISGSRVSLPGFFPGIAPGQFSLTAHQVIGGKVESQGVGVYPAYADLFRDADIKENGIAFTAPLTLTGEYVFRINVRGVDSINTSDVIDFPLAPELKVELAEEVNVGETNLMRWETGNISGRITDPGCTPRISHVTLPFAASFGEIGWVFRAPTTCNIEFTGVNGNTKLYAKKSVRIRAPFVGRTSEDTLDVESNSFDKDGSRLPLHAGGEMVIRGNNFTYEVAVVDGIPVYQPIRVEFEWAGNRATILSATPNEIRLTIPEGLAPGDQIVFQIFRQERVEEDGTVVETSTEPTYFKLSPKPQPVEEKKEE